MHSTLALVQLTQETGSQGGGGLFGAAFTLVWLALMVVIIAGCWKMFTKAGQPGWAAIVPIYNFVVLMKIIGRPAWWVLLMLIPFVNLVIGIIVCIDLAKVFGKGGGFAAGLILLPFIFVPILGFGDAKYKGAIAR